MPNRSLRTLVSTAALTLLSASALAQLPTEKVESNASRPYPPGFECAYDRSAPPCPVRYFHIADITQANDANEILVAIRNIVNPIDKVYLVASTNTIVMSGPAAELDRAAAIVRELDKPHTTYRITYTVTTIDDGKRTGTEHFSTVAVSGQRTTLKQGSKIPVATGTVKSDSATTETQFTYLDIGINLDATVTTTGGNVVMKYKAEQSSVPSEQNIAGVNEPVVRQAVIEGESVLTPGKPVVLGGIDIPGSTRHLDITVEVAPL